MEGYKGLWWEGANNQTLYLRRGGVTTSLPIYFMVRGKTGSYGMATTEAFA